MEHRQVTARKQGKSGRAAQDAVRRAAVLTALLLLSSVPAGCAAGAGDAGALVISEVMSSNDYTLTDETYGTPDWIELYNGTGEDIDLEGYSLTNNAKKLRKFVFPATVIRAGEYLVVYACDAEDDAKSGALATGFSISKEGESLILADAYAGLVQQLQVPELVGDVSYARDASGGYGYTASPTPGAANDDETIERSLSDLLGAGSDALRLNEVLPSPSKGFAWAELYNNSDSAISLNDYYLSDSAAEPLLFRLPSYTLEPGAYALVYFTGGEALSDGDAANAVAAGFSIGANDDCLILSDAAGNRIGALRWDAGVPEDVSVVYGAEEESYAAATPLAGNTGEAWRVEEPTAMDESDPVVISEILPENDGLFPDAEGDCTEWVELVNRSDQAVSLRGYYLSDDPDAPFRAALPDRELGAGEYLVVYLSKKTCDGDEVHVDFGLSVGESIVLTNLDGMRQETIPYEGGCPGNASFGWNDAGETVYYGVPTPGSQNAKSYPCADAVGWFDSGGVFISEVSAAAEDGDWVELGNGSDADVSLDGWSLSDDSDEPEKLSLSGVTIPAGGYAVVRASSGGESGTGGFGISASGECLVLTNASGGICDLFETGFQRGGVTSGRIASDETVGRVFFAEATPGAANAENAASGYTASPFFSVTSLYHTEAFLVTIRCAASGASIYYTTDGSMPTEQSARYTGPIAVSKSVVLRAVAVSDGLLASNETAATYLFTEEHTVPVVCVCIDPAELEEIEDTTDRDYKSEFRADFAFYDEEGSLSASFYAGLRAKGRSMLKYTQKSFSVSLRERYGQSCVSYPFFEDSEILTYSAFSLRSGGQDRGRSRLRDSYFSRLAEGLNIENFKTRVVALYLNGTYYGVFDLNEEQDESYLASHYGADCEKVDIVSRNDEVKQGSAEDFLRVREFARTQDLSDDAVFAQFAQWVDVDYLTDYLAFRSYIADSDMINQAYWRTQDYAVKWRPILFDLDYGLYGNYYQQEYKKDILARYFYENGVSSADGTKTNMDLYVGLKKNAAWRKKFVERYIELMSTTLSPENMLALLDEMDDTYLAEMPRQIAAIAFPASIEYTKQWLEQLRTGIRERPAYAVKYLKENFPDEADYVDELVARYGLVLNEIDAAD